MDDNLYFNGAQITFSVHTQLIPLKYFLILTVVAGCCRLLTSVICLGTATPTGTGTCVVSYTSMDNKGSRGGTEQASSVVRKIRQV